MKSRTTRNHSQSDETKAHELIQQHAHELYMRRGEEPGHELEDWLQAEHEIRDRQQQKISSPTAR